MSVAPGRRAETAKDGVLRTAVWSLSRLLVLIINVKKFSLQTSCGSSATAWGSEDFDAEMFQGVGHLVVDKEGGCLCRERETRDNSILSDLFHRRSRGPLECVVCGCPIDESVKIG